MIKKTLVIATGNPHKFREIKKILTPIFFEFKSLSDINFRKTIVEKGDSYRENARVKAETVGRSTGLLTLAEDSGLEVEALAGGPGIYSARYAKGSDRDRYHKLLSKLKNVPREKRTARFVCLAVLFNPDINKTYFFKGESSGYITTIPKGKKGFGYDPVFFNLDLGKTNAQATEREKNRVSHRARAILKAKKFLLS